MDILDDFSMRAKRYLASLESETVFPSRAALDKLKSLDRALQDDPMDPCEVLALLDEIGSPATVKSAGGRYFGFVIGSSLPAALAANLLAGVWDQNAGLEASSPVAAWLEELCRKWLISALELPEDTGIGYVTGATMANFAGLAAARHSLLEKTGWDVEAEGLFGAPPITVIAGEEAHVSVLKALSMLGLGRERLVRVPVDTQGRLRADAVPVIEGPSIVCLQAGNVNTGAFDPIEEVSRRVKASGAWVHVDGAFGLWAAVSKKRKHLIKGIDKADSWATDAHKWLNVPYDSGLVFVRNGKELHASMSANASYLIDGEKREPFHYVPEMSRRARGIEIWAALKSLGRKGLGDLIDRSCDFAAMIAKELKDAGYIVLNDVVLNQVLVSFGSDGMTARVIKKVQADGTCWCGGTVWQEKTAMRISVSSWATTEKDIERSIDAIISIADSESKNS
jgi:glutamate/tyrosine decarboxylase-like PLP-dependent enzyme